MFRFGLWYHLRGQRRGALNFILQSPNTFITCDTGVVSDFEWEFLNSKETCRGAGVGLFLFSAHDTSGFLLGVGVVFSIHKEMG